MSSGSSADTQIDKFIESRRREREKTEAHQERQAIWTNSVKHHAAQVQREHLQAQCQWHRDQTDRLEGTMTRLIADHRAKATQIQDQLEGREPMPELDLMMRNGRAEIL